MKVSGIGSICDLLVVLLLEHNVEGSHLRYSSDRCRYWRAEVRLDSFSAGMVDRQCVESDPSILDAVDSDPGDRGGIATGRFVR